MLKDTEKKEKNWDGGKEIKGIKKNISFTHKLGVGIAILVILALIIIFTGKSMNWW